MSYVRAIAPLIREQSIAHRSGSQVFLPASGRSGNSTPPGQAPAVEPGDQPAGRRHRRLDWALDRLPPLSLAWARDAFGLDGPGEGAMEFGFTDDQESLRALAVKVLDDHYP